MSCPTKLSIIPVHAHTNYSVLDGVSNIDQYIAWCKKTGSPALGISDHGWAIGLYELYSKCKAAGLTALPGIEFYLAPDKNYQFRTKPYAYFHLTVWAVNQAGYNNIIKLASLSWNQDTIHGYRKEKDQYIPTQVNRVVKRFGAEKPRITFHELLEHHEGLVIASGCLIGVASKAILERENEQASRNIEKLLSVFKGRFFAELLPHTCDHDYSRETKQFKRNECNDFSPDGDLQKPVNQAILELARKYDLPPLMSLDSHFVDQTEKSVQDIILGNGDPDGWKFFNSYHLQTTEEIWEFWKARYGSDEGNRKLFAESIENTHRLAESAKDLQIKTRFHLPKPEIPKAITLSTDNPSEQRKLYLLEKIEAHKRMPWNNPLYVDRLSKELSIICDNGEIDFSDYFLFKEKWSSWARAHSIFQGAGRGSAAGSLLAYLLKITHIDPIQWELPFERFLSMARIKRKKYPDIDSDYGSRDPVVAAMKEEYGDRYAQISTHGTLKIKMAIKDAARVMLKDTKLDIDAITKTIHNTPMGVKDRDFLLGYTDTDGHHHPGHLESNPTLKRFFDTYPDVYQMVLSLLGIPRSLGRHASAVVISDEPIQNTVPTCRVSGELCTQYVASGENFVEKSGLIKFDELTVNSLKDVGDCIRLIQKRFGFDVHQEEVMLADQVFRVSKGELSIETIPTGPKGDPNTKFINAYHLPECPSVFLDLAEGKTKSVFQLESHLLTDFCKRTKPASIKDLSHAVAIVRPGARDAISEDGKTTLDELYIKRKNKKAPVTYAHPGLEPILSHTQGVMVYQEQIQKSFTTFAGYTEEEADSFRELLAKKKKQEVDKFIPELRARLMKNGWSAEQAETFVNVCKASSQYSFNLAHSASYGYDAYICAYLKHFYPIEWWCAVLNNAKVEEIKEKGYDHEVRDILVLPHVNGPTDQFILKNGKIYSPLYLLDGVGDKAAKAITLCRGERDFTSFIDFFDRAKDRAINSKVVKQLILCSAFDGITSKSPQELLKHYYYLRRVSDLKVGRGKAGPELEQAASQYAVENPNEAKVEFPEIEIGPLHLEQHRIKSLPIYRSDVHSVCQKVLSQYFIYEKNKIYRPEQDLKIPVIRNSTEANEHFNSKDKSHDYAIWCGFIDTVKTWDYTDKKTGERVKALKMNVTNAGDTMECILWPNVLASLGAPLEHGLVVAIGKIKKALEPGKFSLFVNDYQEVR